MSATLRPLTVPEAIEQVRALTPWSTGYHALFGLVATQATHQRIDAETVRDAFAGVVAGESLPRIGLTHYGVRITSEFTDEQWACVLPPVTAVAEGAAKGVHGYAIEAATRILGTYEATRLPPGPLRDLLVDVLDPTTCPLRPATLRAHLDEVWLTVGAVRAALARTPTAAPFVRPLLDALRAMR